MTKFADMTARELRKIAPEHGITGASRMTKEQILELLPHGFDRDARDALRRRQESVYDPGAALSTKQRNSLAGQNRENRRWTYATYIDDTRTRVVHRVRRRHAMPAGLLQPAVNADLAKRRIELRRNAFGMVVR